MLLNEKISTNDEAASTSKNLFSYLEAENNNCSSIRKRTKRSKAVSDFRMYIEEKCADINVNPLVYWIEKKSELEGLCKIAFEHLIIPGTSVPSERVFSKAGELISSKRSRLKQKNVSMLMFLSSVQ